jgi:hypothetical protein
VQFQTFLTFPLEADVGAEEIVSHFATSDTLDGVNGFKGIYCQSIHFFLSFVHFHFAVLGEELPHATFHSQSGVL